MSDVGFAGDARVESYGNEAKELSVPDCYESS